MYCMKYSSDASSSIFSGVKCVLLSVDFTLGLQRGCFKLNILIKQRVMNFDVSINMLEFYFNLSKCFAEYSARIASKKISIF